MPNVMGILLPLVQIAVIVGVIAAIVALARRRGGEREERDEPGIGTVRRLYLYGLSFAGLVAAATGAVLLLRSILDTLFGPTAISIESTTLALGLALTVVGTPIWLIFWGMAQRSVREFPVETRDVSRNEYLYLVLGVSGIVVSIAAIMFLRWVFAADDFSGTPVSLMLVGGGVWAFHWLVQKRQGQPSDLIASIRRVYVYGLALLGVVLLALGAGGVLRMVLGAGYDALFGAPDLLTGKQPGPWNEATQTSLAMAMVGVAVWWWHWHRVARGDAESTLRHVYLYLFGVLGGTATVVLSLSILFFHILQWFMGRPETTSARLHFDVVPGLVAAITVGGGLWTYHWAVVQQEAREARRELAAVRRVYGYLVSAVGLVTLGVGLVTVFAVAIGLLSPTEGAAIVGADWWRNPLVLGITLLAVGVPVWGLYWRDMQRAAARGGPGERAVLSRRVFIFLTFGISVLLTLINLSIALFRLFDAALGEGAFSGLLWEVRWSVGILLTAGAISIYYWLVLQEDRKAMAQLEKAVTPGIAPPPEGRTRKSVTVLAFEQDRPVVRRLEVCLGYGVQVWRLAGEQSPAPPLSDDYLAETEQRIASAASDKVLLLIDADGIQVMPYSLA